MSQVVLYHTAACHLCEEAEELVMAYFAAHGVEPISLVRMDVADDAALLARYGLLIPVLSEVATGRELCWPFDLNDISRFFL